jgi:hypothetical protein
MCDGYDASTDNAVGPMKEMRSEEVRKMRGRLSASTVKASSSPRL